MDIGNKIRELRTRKGLTLEELAIDSLSDILEALGTNLAEFFQEDKNDQFIFHADDFFVDEREDCTVNWIVPNTQKNQMEPILLELPEGGYLIDTPGIKGFGTFDMEPEELTSYFKDIFHFSKECRFNNCTHTHEPGCAVLKAVEEHYIAASRYQSYLSMLEDKDENKYREAY